MISLQRYLDPELLRRLSALSLSARTVAAGTTTGRHRAPVRGSSIEFRQHRFYTPGDEPRRIDFRVLARTDRPYVREYEQETNLRCLLLLDASGSMAYPVADSGKLFYARRAAAALAYVMLAQTESVGLAAFGGTSHFLPPHAGDAQLTRLIDALDRIVPAGSANLASAAAAVANRLGRRTLVVLFSDLFYPPEAIARALARLRHDRHEVLAVRILHPDELDFPLRSWTRLVGAEGEGNRIVEPATARNAYLRGFAEHRDQLAAALQPLAVKLHTWRTDQPLADNVTRLAHGLSDSARHVP
jgi:uncharacterized protein (DUF58 family)